MIKIAIAEDDTDFIQKYKDMIEQYMSKHSVNCKVDDYKNAKELLDGTMDYDLFCLDIEMPGINGLELAGEIRRVCGNKPDIAFVTAYENAVYDVFRYNALGFLRKSL